MKVNIIVIEDKEVCAGDIVMSESNIPYVATLIESDLWFVSLETGNSCNKYNISIAKNLGSELTIDIKL